MNVGAFSVLTASPEAQSSSAAPRKGGAADDAHFLGALLAALGLGGGVAPASEDAVLEEAPRFVQDLLANSLADGADGDSPVGRWDRPAVDAAAAQAALFEARADAAGGPDTTASTNGFATAPQMGQGSTGVAAAGEATTLDSARAVAAAGQVAATGFEGRSRSSTASSARAVAADLATERLEASSDVVAVNQVDAARMISPALAPSAPTPVADPSLDDVAPELREKVERVIERMREEFGHEVTVVEGYRSPERQAELYEQGRTRPGQIATWTRRSWHSEGLAADLMVDGSYGDRQAYARLQRIAREEGLRTLGSRDLGHVELPRTMSVETPSEAPTLAGKRFVGVATPASPARVAAVAPVAVPGQWVSVTPEAPVAPPAPALGPRAEARTAEAERIEAPINSGVPQGPLTRVAEDGPARNVTSQSATTFAGGRAAQTGEGSTESGSREDSDGRRSRRDEAVTATRGATRDTDARFGAAPDASGVSTPARAEAIAGPEGPTTLDQIDRVEQARELARAIRPSRISVRLDGAGSDQLRVGMLNRAVDAELDLADPSTAEMVRTRVDELHRSLASRGLGLDALSVNGVSSAGREGWLSTPAETANDLLRTLFASTPGDPGREGQGRERPAHDPRTNQDGGSQSNRSRRERQTEE